MNRRHFVASGVAAAIAAGEPTLEDIYSHIETNLPVHIENIQRYIRQPSISAEKLGIAECAELTRSFLKRAGCQDAEVIPTEGHPVVWGRLDAGAAKTLIIYWMYDVQPVNASEWATPPFDAQVVDAPTWGPKGRLLRGRGASNQKGPERAFLNAVESIRAVRKNLPVNLLFICEGEEELGSPNLPEAMKKLKPRLSAANGVLFPSVTLGRDGVASFALGNKGVAYIELECRGGARGGPTHSEVHSSLKAVTDSPVWRLVQALATFTDRSGNHIAIEGVRDRIRQPNTRESELFETYLSDWDEAAARRGAQAQRWADGVDKREALRRLWFEPSLNIDGIWGGYNGPGSKTILPHKASVKVDFRLVPDQRAADIVPLVRKHLDKLGFDDIVVNWWNGYDPSQSDPDSSLIKAALDVCRANGIRTQVAVRMAGSAPHYLFTRDLKLPLLSFGLGLGGGAHGVNEFMVIDAAAPARGLAFLERSFVDILYRFANL